METLRIAFELTEVDAGAGAYRETDIAWAGPAATANRERPTLRR